jgi:hypothetical protein
MYYDFQDFLNFFLVHGLIKFLCMLILNKNNEFLRNIHCHLLEKFSNLKEGERVWTEVGANDDI